MKKRIPRKIKKRARKYHEWLEGGRIEFDYSTVNHTPEGWEVIVYIYKNTNE